MPILVIAEHDQQQLADATRNAYYRRCKTG